jgi:hypothetical protein
MKTRNTFIMLAGFLGIALFISSCKKKAPPPPPPEPVVEVVPSPVDETPKEKPVYVYSGDRFRDPFTPAGLSTSYQPDAVFDPQRAVIRGIIFGPKLQSAVLSIGGTGTYFVKEGRIYDIMGKFVEGYKAKVAKDKVTITGEADNVFELKLQDSPGEDKSL